LRPGIRNASIMVMNVFWSIAPAAPGACAGAPARPAAPAAPVAGSSASTWRATATSRGGHLLAGPGIERRWGAESRRSPTPSTTEHHHERREVTGRRELPDHAQRCRVCPRGLE
jgi:hypothetical protein